MTQEQIHALSDAVTGAITGAAELAALRDRTRADVVRQIRAIEAALHLVLQESGLPAFVNLANLGSGSLPLRGLNVRGDSAGAKLKRPSWMGEPPESLILDGKGYLMMAKLVRDDTGQALSLRAAIDDDFELDDLERVAETAAALLHDQAEALEARAATLARIEALRANLDAALDAWEAGGAVRPVQETA